MSVLLKLMIVIIHALTLMVVMCVIVMLDMYLILMDQPALVSVLSNLLHQLIHYTCLCR